MRLDVISNGRYHNVVDGRLVPIAGNLNDGDQVRSASVSSDRTRIAAVRGPRPHRGRAGATGASGGARPNW